MNFMITFPFLFAVTLIKSSGAAECSAPYTCLPFSECLSAHQARGGLSGVLLPCSRSRRQRVCCPEVSPLVGPLPTPPSTSLTLKADVAAIAIATEPTVVDPKKHANFALLPSAENCGRAALDKLKVDLSDLAGASFDNKVIDGDKAVEGADPWMALLFFETTQGKKERVFAKCGGTLINARYVLTAAHCFSNPLERIKYVRLAEYDTRIKNCKKKSKKCPKNVQINKKIIIHELFNITTVKNDIALIRLQEDVLPTDNPKIAPICLPFDTTTTVVADTKFRLVGWGKTDKDNSVGSPVLQEVKIHATGECSTCPEGRPEPLAICPLSPTEQLCVQVNRKKSPCQGDSGGPLMIEMEKDHFVQVGVISLMPGACGDTGVPAIYTRVDGYLLWILDHIQP